MSKKKILIVEDEIKILEVVTSLMEKQGYEVYQAEDGKQALKIFYNNEISLIILDLMLPDISGEEICMKIREKSRVPIIMLTAKVDESNLLQGLDLSLIHIYMRLIMKNHTHVLTLIQKVLYLN